MKFHDTLNKKLWNGFELKEDVSEKLKEIAKAFEEYLEIPEDAILDERITGSSANYNYTKYSDLDLHIIVDLEKVHEDCPVVEGYLWALKSIFNKEHDISIYGVPIEVYAEDSTTEAISNGMYSLRNNEWIKKPEKIEPTDNDEAVKSKYNELKQACEKVDDSEVAQELLNKIYTMRKAGLEENGEFSTENLAFKLLRNDGYLDKLRELKKEKVDKELSLESFNLESLKLKIYEAEEITVIKDGNLKLPVDELDIKQYDVHHRYGTDWVTEYNYVTDKSLTQEEFDKIIEQQENKPYGQLEYSKRKLTYKNGKTYYRHILKASMY